mmetsp:Transcript_29144/g.74031  ORF Transcript_29144/g.74031 Transcript_29144/m.74031 type:complete len:392 (-) Transcript_29144:176-1351(-)
MGLGTLEIDMSPEALHSPRALYVAAHAMLGLLLVVTSVVIVPVLVQMLLYTGSILYIGSHHSLSLFDEDPSTGKAAKVETVSKKDAMLFPVIGSVALFSMYLAYKVFGTYWVNVLLTTYLTCVGLVALAETLRPILAPLLPEGTRKWSKEVELGHPLLLKAVGEPVHLRFGKDHILAYVLAACASAGFLLTKHHAIHNLFAVAFSLKAIAMISLGRFVVAFILLSGLFVYDIFWVFGTEVMVSVATQFTGPIKIIFPVTFDPWKQSILGLGDIVIPGILVAMCLRFDASLHRNGGKERLTIDSAFPKPYFWRVYAGYLVSLLLSGLIMLGLKKAQPALLYLVPGTILTLVGSSYLRGQFKEMTAYNEEDLNSEDADADDSKKDADDSKKDQ